MMPMGDRTTAVQQNDFFKLCFHNGNWR
jgi:hypothetical protein